MNWVIFINKLKKNKNKITNSVMFDFLNFNIKNLKPYPFKIRYKVYIFSFLNKKNFMFKLIFWFHFFLLFSNKITLDRHIKLLIIKNINLYTFNLITRHS